MKSIPTLCAPAVAVLVLASCYETYEPAYAARSYEPGYLVTDLPPGYETAVVGGTRYYHHGNVFYRPQGSRYVVVERPDRLPSHADRDRDGIPNWSDPNPLRPDDRRGYRRDGDGFVVVRDPF